ncbi:hypothetical protein DJ68_13035 [Halorubrum sp. C3]|nr:hypothetical protein DJ68_13035 [Halorubrum sp. C3]
MFEFVLYFSYSFLVSYFLVVLLYCWVVWVQLVREGFAVRFLPGSMRFIVGRFVTVLVLMRYMMAWI